MTTLDTTETLEQIAERIAKWQYWLEPSGHLAPYQQVLANKILSALRGERNRCVRVAKDAYERLDTLNAEGAEPMRAVLKVIREGR